MSTRKTEPLKIQNFDLVLAEANLSMRLRLSKLEAEMQVKTAEQPDLADEDRVQLTYFYPRLAASVQSGTVPTPDEFLDFKDTETDAWYLLALKLNPHWFEEIKTEVVTNTEILQKKDN